MICLSNVVTTKEYEVHYYEVNHNKEVLFTSLMNYFGDISNYQSEQRKVGIEYMNEQGIAWVIFKWDINVKRYPKYGEKVKVTTEPFSFRKFYAYRKFTVKDESGNVIVTADSVWMLIDCNKRKPLRITNAMYEAYGLTIEDNEEIKIKKLRSPEEFDGEKHFYVRYSDIDTNNHVNNVNYVAWAIESVPEEIMSNYKLSNVIVTYEKETYYGDMVKVRMKMNRINECEVVCTHVIESSEGMELTLIETSWAIK